MTLTNFTSEHLKPSRLNGNFIECLTLQGLNTIRTLQDRGITYSKGMIDGWGDAYTSSSGRSGSVLYSSATFDTNKYKSSTSQFGTNYIIINATSIRSVASFAVNNCIIIPIDDGVWIFGSTTGTDAQRRANIIKTLYYGTNGADPRLGYITGLTALKTTVAGDVGKKGYLFWKSFSGFSFSNLSNNVRRFTSPVNLAASGNIEIWANSTNAQYSTANRSGGDTDALIRAPAGSTTILDMSSAWADDASYTSIGTTTTGTATGVSSFDIQTPYVEDNYSGSARGAAYRSEAIILTTQNLTLGTETAPGGAYDAYYAAATLTLYGTTFTAVTSSDIVFNIQHTIPSGTFPANISSSVFVPMIANWETGADIKYKIQSGFAETTAAAGGSTITGGGIWTDQANAFDMNDATFAYFSLGAYDTGNYIGKTFSATYVKSIIFSGGLATANTHDASIEVSYDGTTWVELWGVNSDATATHSDTVSVNATIYGVRMLIENPGAGSGYTGRVYTLNLVTYTAVSDDTGWIDCANTPSIQAFTAFTSEPSRLLVKLTPKSSSPTHEYPAIHGFWVRAA